MGVGGDRKYTSNRSVLVCFLQGRLPEPGRQLDAGRAEGNDLPRIAQAPRIEGLADAAHEREVRLGEDEAHPLALLDADAVLAGQRATDLDAGGEDFRPRGRHAAALLVAAVVEEDAGMEVPVAGVEDVRHAD